MVERPSNTLSSPTLPIYSPSPLKSVSSSKQSASPDTLRSHKPLPDMADLLDEIVYLIGIIEQANQPTSRLLKPEISPEEALEQLKGHQKYLEQLDHWSQACQSRIDKMLQLKPSLFQKLLNLFTK